MTMSLRRDEKADLGHLDRHLDNLGDWLADAEGAIYLGSLGIVTLHTIDDWTMFVSLFQGYYYNPA